MFDGSMWGMHFGWWIFWIAIVVAAWAVFKGSRPRHTEDPAEILLRRYATGEILTEEYEDQMARMRRDHA